MYRKPLILAALILLVLFSTGAALAVVEAGYGLGWWTSDGGGGTSTGTGYSLSGTIGQPDAGPLLIGPGYQLSGGFWGGALSDEEGFELYLPLVLKP